MSVLIKGMEMPKEDSVLFFITPNGSVWKINWDERENELIAEAIEIPDHGRLVDADALIRDWPTGFVKTADVINNAPTIIPADVTDQEQPSHSPSLGYYYAFEFDETTGETYMPKEE